MNASKCFIAITALASFLPQHLSAQPDREEANILHLVQRFFDALEKQDTTVFQELCLKEARNFIVREVQDSVVVRSQPSRAIRFNPEQMLKETMRLPSTEIKVEGRIAMAWVPYDFWVNDKFSHCGVDVFTFIQTRDGWRISSVAYTVETAGCQ